MRGSLALASCLVATPAAAEPFEASGFIGLGVFGDDIELGNSWAPEQVPNTAPVVGARLGWLAVPRLAGSRFGLALEGELSFATAFTGGSSFEGDRGRMSYFAPVFGWRGHGMLRFGGLPSVTPHLIVGAGGATVTSSSPFMSKETDPVVYWGPGVSITLSDRWRVRIDVRHGITSGREDATSSTLEAQLGLAATFGDTRKAPIQDPVIVKNDPDPDPVPDPPLLPDPRADIQPPDPDGDGMSSALDLCPDAPEDFDKHEDADGCPDPDNDGDGFEDVRDVCPLLAEVKNGVDDADGCPDTVPDNVVKALALGPKLTFEANRARVTPAAAAMLRPLYLMLLAHPDVLIRIAGRPDKAGNEDLAKRRADAVKWWLVDQGITEGRIAISLAEPGKPTIELTLRTE